MSVKMMRRGSPRCIGLLALLAIALVCFYYISYGQQIGGTKTILLHSGETAALVSDSGESETGGYDGRYYDRSTRTTWNKCVQLKESMSDITTQEEFAKFDFQPNWLRNREFWDTSFESRWEHNKRDMSRPNLRVIITPFSHNDPGWLKTFTNYFQSDTRQILDHLITKMHQYTDLTFIWAEISYLQLWWDQAHPTKQRALRNLLDSGRFEIVTGGWVMTDEANVHVYAMVDQLIEGHQWLKDNLNYTPTTGFSIDPFGHGSTLPYLLAASDFKGTIIQRIHYAWKQFFAKHQYGDFYWQPNWQAQNAAERTLLTHNMPFDIYSIRHSCGPHPAICLNYDFRKIPGEYTDYSVKAQFITDENVESKADILMEQYSKAASLFPHNVAFVPLGDDFRYNYEIELEQQYTNYKRLIDFVNANPQRYNNTHISFGVPGDYFEEINKRYHDYPHLKGDFFVYSDIFTEGKPAYWSGYYSTRPMYKMLGRELEQILRSAEILFTVAFNHARQHQNANTLRILEKNYEKLTLARRNMGLFQHHDAITGTSKAAVMRDYGLRLFESIRDSVHLQEMAIELLVQNGSVSEKHGFVVSELERESFNKIPKRTLIYSHDGNVADVILFNSLAQQRLEMVTLRTSSSNVKVFDNHGSEVKIQVNPVWNLTDSYDLSKLNVLRASNQQFEILFIANLAPLSLAKYTVRHVNDGDRRQAATITTIYCNECKGSNDVDDNFDIKPRQTGDVQLENVKMRLLFDGVSGFMKTLTSKAHHKSLPCAVNFAAYRSAQFHSGAYLFKPDSEERDMEKDVLEQYDGNQLVFITSGPIASDVTVVYGNFLAHTVRIFNSGTAFDNAIYIENDVNFESPPKNRETEMFMRLVTGIDNGVRPVMYSDQNGFQYMRREKVPNLGVEANYYPITSGAFIQDSELRLTLLTNHAQGAASVEPGYLEVMLDRRTLYDDNRGMGEGIVDNQLTQQRYWLVLEQLVGDGAHGTQTHEYENPSNFVQQMSNTLNYPVNMFLVERQERSADITIAATYEPFKMHFPCNVHLTTLRTQTERDLQQFPSQRALMVLHHQAASCKVRDVNPICHSDNGFIAHGADIFHDIRLQSIHKTSLTGIRQQNRVAQFANVHIEPMDIATFNLTFV